MSRRGIALLVVLWLLVALSALGAVSLTTAHEGSDVSRNRIWLRRAEWAREACAEILLARWQQPDGATGPDLLNKLHSVDLGRGTWCSARLENPNAKLNLNTASPEIIQSVLILYYPFEIEPQLLEIARQAGALGPVVSCSRA